MSDPTERELDAIHAARERQYSGAWFHDLLAGRLGPGETYWMGWLGVALVVLPSLFLGYLLIGGVSLRLAEILAGLVMLAIGAYRLALLRALAISLRREPAGGWGRAGLALTALDAALWLMAAGWLLTPR